MSAVNIPLFYLLLVGNGHEVNEGRVDPRHSEPLREALRSTALILHLNCVYFFLHVPVRSVHAHRFFHADQKCLQTTRLAVHSQYIFWHSVRCHRSKVADSGWLHIFATSFLRQKSQKDWDRRIILIQTYDKQKMYLFQLIPFHSIYSCKNSTVVII